MRALLALYLVASACSNGATPTAAPAPVRSCDGYSRAVGEAEQAPPTPGDDVEVEVVSSCGCARTIHTTAARAAAVRDEHQRWTRAGCRSINCDTPCSAMVTPR
jgi:hypothetical protein